MTEQPWTEHPSMWTLNTTPDRRVRLAFLGEDITAPPIVEVAMTAEFAEALSSQLVTQAAAARRRGTGG